MRTTAILGAVLLAASSAPAQTPELYGEVTSIHWVVKDLAAVSAGWSRLGFPVLQDFGEVSLPVQYAGESGVATLRIAQSRIAGVDVFWLQPVSGRSAWSEFLTRRGDGVMSLNYSAPSREALDAEVARLESAGVDVLQVTDTDAGQGPLRIVHMNTESQGKYVLGLVSGSVPGPPSTAPASTYGPKLSQYALVVHDLATVSGYWAKLGLPAMDVTHPTLTDLEYKGEPGRFDQKLGWHRHGTVTWEWIEPLAGPTTYQDFLDAHGEGFHHLAFDVPDMDAAIEAWEAAGHPIVQSGGWGEKGQPGSGRFAYADTASIGGVTVELLWNYPSP